MLWTRPPLNWQPATADPQDGPILGISGGFKRKIMNHGILFGNTRTVREMIMKMAGVNSDDSDLPESSPQHLANLLSHFQRHSMDANAS
jgi:hypothetical protein